MGITAGQRFLRIDTVPGGHDLREQDERTRRASEPRRGCTLARWGVAILIVAGFVGDLTMPATVERFPLLLVLLNPRWRMFLLVSTRLDAGLFVAFGLVRRLLTVVVFYRAGRCGIGRGRTFRSRTGPKRRWSQRFQEWFRRSSAVLLVAFPGAPASFLAGVQAMPLAKVVALTSVGNLARLLVLTHIGGALAEPLDQAIRFIGAHRLEFAGIILACIVVRGLRIWVRIGRRASEEESGDRPPEQQVTSMEMAD